MIFSSLFLCTLLVAAPYAGAHTKTYTAELEPFGDNSQVSGKVVVFTAHGGIVAYAGSAALLEVDLTGTACTEVINGCGVHIHSGTSCFDTTTQGGHYYTDPVLSDPWINERYLTSEPTSAGFYEGDFKGMISIGTIDIEGHAFVVHGQDGSRVACGILRETTENVYTTYTEPLGDATVTSNITAISGIKEADQVCFFGMAYGLERELVSVMANPSGPDCTASNGCGLHMQSGTACADSTTQGGHFHSTSSDDPWLPVGYSRTDAAGQAMFFHCVLTGESDFEGRAFIVHANDGSRVSCGLLLPAELDETASSGGKLAPFLASALTMLTAAVLAVTF